jgi:hypothetical protein
MVCGVLFLRCAAGDKERMLGWSVMACGTGRNILVHSLHWEGTKTSKDLVVPCVPGLVIIRTKPLGPLWFF